MSWADLHQMVLIFTFSILIRLCLGLACNILGYNSLALLTCNNEYILQNLLLQTLIHVLDRILNFSMDGVLSHSINSGLFTFHFQTHFDWLTIHYISASYMPELDDPGDEFKDEMGEGRGT